MVSLMDIAPANKTVNIRGLDLRVTGISVRGLALLLSDFPELRELVSNREVHFTQALTELAPRAVASVIAAGLGYPGDKEAIAKVDDLNVGEQFELLDAILILSFPGGLGPFLERLESLIPGIGELTKEAASK